jgi:Uri superfamily endonuclease
MSKGSYVLFIHMPKSKGIDVGRLGSCHFEAGTYLYVGSVLNTLQKRLACHASQTKKLHWHIDYLLQYATIKKFFNIHLWRLT